eukprot:scaffold37080_cov48-Attheya_sp.AAC.4
MGFNYCQLDSLVALVLLAASSSVVRGVNNGPVSSSMLRYCNRGFCYTKREPELHHHHHHHRTNHGPVLFSTGDSKRSGIDVCTDSHGKVLDCDVFEILGMDQEEMNIEYESLESTGTTRVPSSRMIAKKLDNTEITEAVIELDDNEIPEKKEGGQHHISWRQRPHKGKCFDSDQGYAFDCALIEIIE